MSKYATPNGVHSSQADTKFNTCRHTHTHTDIGDNKAEENTGELEWVFKFLVKKKIT